MAFVYATSTSLVL